MYARTKKHHQFIKKILMPGDVFSQSKRKIMSSAATFLKMLMKMLFVFIRCGQSSFFELPEQDQARNGDTVHGGRLNRDER